MRRLFGTDGVRGIANAELTCERALKIGRALSAVLSPKGEKANVVVGMDTRLSSEMLCAALCAGLCSAGSDCTLLGVLPTPAVAHLVQKYGAKAGVMISASHNPYPYNGVKVFGEEGFKLSDELEEQIESIVLDDTPPVSLPPAHGIGKVTRAENAVEDYIDYLRGCISARLDGLHLVLDCANGAASTTAERLFSSLGAKCTVLSAAPNGTNINDACGSTDLRALRLRVKEEGADAGLAFDGDADRLLAVDEKGNEVDGDFIMALLSLALKEKGKLKREGVVGTIMNNFGLTRFCEEHGMRFITTNVGDRYVLETINRDGYSFGGEQSGHIVLRELSTTGDGQLTALCLLARMKETGLTLSELCKVMKKYPQRTVNVSATREGKLAVFTDSEIKRAVSEVEERLGGKGRIVLRPSGTEPVVRVMVEAENEEEVEELCSFLASVIERELKNY